MCIGLFVFSSSGIGGYIAGYDLTLGIPDAMGIDYAMLFSSYKVTLDKPISYMGITVSSFTDPLAGPKLLSPTSEVKDAWRKGWTGKDVNTLHVDVFDESFNYHGIKTMMITDLVAVGVSKYAINAGWYTVDQGCDSETQLLPKGPVKSSDGANIISKKNIAVVNISLGFDYYFNNLNPNVSTDVETAFIKSESGGAAKAWRNVFNSKIPAEKLNADVADAVIVKAAGNYAIDTANEPWSYTFAADANINPRLLLVGATTSDGTVSSKTSLAYNSNIAGDNPIIRNRFLVANGNSPYATGDISIDGNPMSAGAGTSYAAPRVTGYAAILRHKFPNLNAENTASILLDTARYDTLTCYPDCPVSVYGKGEASISRALAPVGRLR